MIDIIETVYRGAAKGRGLVVSPKGTDVTLSGFFLALTRHFRLLYAVSLLVPAIKIVSLAWESMCVLNG